LTDTDNKHQESESPETDQILKPAAFRYRLLSIIYDTLILLGIWILTIVLLVTLIQDYVVGAWVQSLLFIESFVFFTYFWIARGQTAGMVAWRLQIQCEVRFTLRHAFLRFIGGMLGLACVGLGFLWIYIDKDRRSWSDIFSNSQIVRANKVR